MWRIKDTYLKLVLKYNSWDCLFYIGKVKLYKVDIDRTWFTSCEPFLRNSVATESISRRSWCLLVSWNPIKRIQHIKTGITYCHGYIQGHPMQLNLILHKTECLVNNAVLHVYCTPKLGTFEKCCKNGTKPLHSYNNRRFETLTST